jgi:hypothetical protein
MRGFENRAYLNMKPCQKKNFDKGKRDRVNKLPPGI